MTASDLECAEGTLSVLEGHFCYLKPL